MKFIIKKKQPKTTTKFMIEGAEIDGSQNIHYCLFETYPTQYDANKQFCQLKLFGDYDQLWLLEVEMTSEDEVEEYVETIEFWDKSDDK